MKYSLLITIQLIMISCGPNNRNDCYIRGNKCPAAAAGADGYSTAIEVSQVSNCPNGGTTIFMGRDLDRNGVLRYTPDANITSVAVCSGTNGSQGSQGVQGSQGIQGPATPINIIDPCGKQSANDEILIRLSDRTIISSFSDSASGANTRFALLGPGNYITTDATNCHFTVQPNLDITF